MVWRDQSLTFLSLTNIPLIYMIICYMLVNVSSLSGLPNVQDTVDHGNLRLRKLTIKVALPTKMYLLA